MTRGQCQLALVMLGVAFLVIKIYPNYPSGRLGVILYYSTSSHHERKEFQATKEDMMRLPVDSSTHITVIIHGYTESSVRPWIINLTNTMLSEDRSGVVVMVDYYDLTTISRPYMMETVREVANVTARMLDLLVEECGARLEQMHLMGFSLGGRISGIVGNRTKTGKIGRITGLDASYPWMPPYTLDEYLDAGDATLVVNLRTSKVGSLSPPGHIDFYVNGGLDQPGCQKWYLIGAAQHVCNHYLAVWLTMEAMASKDDQVFPACQCLNWESFLDQTCKCETLNFYGLMTDPGVQGKFYLMTNPEPPYSRALPLQH